jgi:hypothetical protein
MKVKKFWHDKNGTHHIEYKYEPINSTIYVGLQQFYNLMALIGNSLDKTKYKLENWASANSVGYFIYDKNTKCLGYFGCHEEDSNHILFELIDGDIMKNINTNETKTIKFIKNENKMFYTRISFDEIINEKTLQKQQKVIQDWVNQILKEVS